MSVVKEMVLLDLELDIAPELSLKKQLFLRRELCLRFNTSPGPHVHCLLNQVTKGKKLGFLLYQTDVTHQTVAANQRKPPSVK